MVEDTIQLIKFPERKVLRIKDIPHCLVSV